MCKLKEVSNFQEPPVQEAVHFVDAVPITAEMLAAATPQEQKNLFAERLFPRLEFMYARFASVITCILIQLDNTELLRMLDDTQYLETKAEEAMVLWQSHQARLAAETQPKMFKY